jgi:hypothetical protein
MPRVRKVDPNQTELFATDYGSAPKKNGNNRAFASQQSLASYIWSTCGILRRSNCAGALQYVPS